MQANKQVQVRARGVSGFTLIELLLVMAILAVLAAVVVPKFVNRGEEAKIQKAKTDISLLENQLDVFNTDLGTYPSTDQGLQALVQNVGNWKDWKGPYIKEVPTDPWGNAYIYTNPGTLNPQGIDIVCVGKDGQEGTQDDINNGPSTGK
ncbi:MAG TPA: type II secretion system major pseudopilin GspG [Phycisphaerae bacterium]|jgi:general secretion pathway protein G|nr:type II secretion system major pseudopilin GspG [Phycisphaerae bacterium]